MKSDLKKSKVDFCVAMLNNLKKVLSQVIMKRYVKSLRAILMQMNIITRL